MTTSSGRAGQEPQEGTVTVSREHAIQAAIQFKLAALAEPVINA